eukprot:scaffold8114_cov126-Cylindrotheca_fusiformis.AAC.4
MRLSLVIMAILGFAIQNSEAFVKGSSTTRSRPQLSTSNTELYAAAKKTAKKKAASKKAEVETFRKPQFIAEVAERLDTTKVEAEAVLAAVLDTISDNVVDGKKVNLPGFGTFQLRFRAARKGRNPQTGEELDIKASYSPGFTASKAFKEKANE